MRSQPLILAAIIGIGILLALAHAAISEDRPIVAVFDVEVKGAKMAAGTPDRLTDYLGSLMAARGYKVVPRSQLKERLRQEKKSSYQLCYDQSCQIEIGKEMAAQKSLASQVLKFGDTCRVTLTLFDLLQAASEGAGTFSGGCKESEVADSLEKAVANLLGGGTQAAPAKPAPVVEPPKPLPVVEPPKPVATPYTSDANTLLLDHFENGSSGSILAYIENGVPCGDARPVATPNSSFGPGPAGLNQALTLGPPVGQPSGSATYLKYGGGQILSQANGTIEFWVFLTSYGTGLALVDQGPYYGSCAGWTFGMGLDQKGQLNAGAWNAFTMNSGTTTVPLNTWTHVAATWGSAGAKLYINGVQVGSDANTGMPAAGFGGSLMLRLGTPAGVTARIDELRISGIQRTTFR